MDPDTLAEEEQFLRDWAADNKVVYDPEGECGFGRECVGMRSGNHWVDLQVLDGATYLPVEGESLPWVDVCAPAGVDAYHKHDCLVVLGRGPEAIHGLYQWVRQLEAKNIGVEVKHRAGLQNMDRLQLLFHGPTVPVLIRKE